MSLLKYTFIIGLFIPNFLFGQIIEEDTTDLFRYIYIVYCDPEEGYLEEPIDLEWVQMDKDIIRKKINPLPSSGSTIEGIKHIIPYFLGKHYNEVSVTEDLAYGLKSTHHTLHGSYSSYHIEVIYFDNRIIKLRLTIKSDRRVLRDHLLDEMKLRFECLNRQVSYEITYQENLDKYQSDFGQLFIESADTISRRQRAINYFTDVMQSGIFSKPYYVAFRLGPETFNHLRYFIVTKDYDALENILFSPSPTGRLFAARTLLYMKDEFGYIPDDKTNQRMIETINNAQLIMSGAIGDITGNTKYDNFDIVKDFEKLLATE